jgi:hypothetical protein
LEVGPEDLNPVIKISLVVGDLMEKFEKYN